MEILKDFPLEKKKDWKDIPVETETALEVQELFKNREDWNKAKDELKKYQASPDSDFYVGHPWDYLFLASEMRKFDLECFDKEIKISDNQWQCLIDVVKRSQDNLGHFLRCASSLAALDSERFKRDIKIDDKHWKKIVEEVESKRDFPLWFMQRYEMAHSVDSQKTEEEILINKDYWEKINDDAGQGKYSLTDHIMLIGCAQRMKPEEFFDIKVLPERWGKTMHFLKNRLKNNTPPVALTFLYANALRDVKVE